MTPEQEHGEACSICGRILDSITPVVEVELRGRVLRACAGECRTPAGDPVWLDPDFQTEQRRDFARRLDQTYAVLERARDDKSGDVLAVIDLTLRVMAERRRVLGLDAPVQVELVTEPDPRISDTAVMQAARRAAREQYDDED